MLGARIGRLARASLFVRHPSLGALSGSSDWLECARPFPSRNRGSSALTPSFSALDRPSRFRPRQSLGQGAGILFAGSARCLLVLLGCLALSAQPVPKLNSLDSDWLQRATTNEVTCDGENLAGVSRIVVSGPSGVAAELVESPVPAATIEASAGGLGPAMDGDRRRMIRFRTSPTAALAAREIRAITPGGVSNPLTIHVGYLPEVHANGSNHETNKAQWVDLPASISGTIREAGQVDYFRFKGQHGVRLIFDVQANRLGLPLDPSLGLHDADGIELQRREDDNGFDPLLDFTPDKDGDYIISLRDFRFQGGGDFKYRIVAGALPYVDSVFPLGGQRGQTLDVSLRGRNLEELPSMKMAIAHDAPLGLQEIRAHTQRGYSNAKMFDVGDSPEFTESEPNNATNQANVVTLPVAINGRIQGEKDIDTFKFKVEKGQTWIFEVYAARLGSSLDALLTLMDATGKVIERNDDASGSDPRMERGFGEAGEYYLSVRDLLNREGEDFSYRLVARAPQPDFSVKALSDTIRVHRGGRSAVRLEVDRKAGFGGGVEVVASALPAGVSCAPLVIPPELSGGTLVISASADAALASEPMALEGIGSIGGRRVSRSVQPTASDRSVKEGFITVLDQAPFSVEWLTMNAVLEENQSTTLEAVVQRAPAYLEDIKVSLEGFSTGRDAITRSLDVGTVTLKGGDTRVAMNVKAKLDAELGTRPVWLRVEGKANGQPLDIVSRTIELTVREFPFELVNSLPRLSLTALPASAKSAASEAEFTVRVNRRGWFTDDVNLTLEGLPEGVTATTANLPRNSSEVAIKLTATEKAATGKEVNLSVVGTANVNGRSYQVRAPELKLSINAPADAGGDVPTKVAAAADPAQPAKP